MTGTDLDTLSINTIRGLSMDAVQRARSGHPGTPMRIAPVAYTLWQRFLRFDPSDPRRRGSISTTPRTASPTRRCASCSSSRGSPSWSSAGT